MTRAPARRLAHRDVVKWLAICVASATVAPPLPAQTVRAVLFHSPSCPHCRQVISQDLPVFFQVYGGDPAVTEAAPHLTLVGNGQLEILFVDASQPAGTRLYDASLQAYPVSEDRLGVPRMIVDDSVLVGSFEIPSRLHAIIRNGLATGGIDWPAIPGLADVVAGPPNRAEAAGAADTAEEGGVGEVGGGPDSKSVAPDTGAPDTGLPAESGAPPRLEDVGATRPAGLGARFARDPVGNGFAVVVLVLMLGALAAVLAGIPRRTGPREPGFWMPLLIVAGALVSVYLAYVETTGATAVCGPVGDCNTVQQSRYATLFGVVPIGILGLVGYGLMLVLWVFGLEGRPSSGTARRLLLAATVAGTAFSIYLTFLEPFVIGATCLWCLSSAAIVTALAWLSAAWTQRAAA